ncbi:hypothetical protein [Rhodococcus sp. BS-15]|uniref:hypothetical protein n=1 Tax=Rhodococcus sp. BS-15 TaxID=1304954 RepID=UPI001650EB49|nr:hypothetical protein [Rhodococcus sp. BS-15]
MVAAPDSVGCGVVVGALELGGRIEVDGPVAVVSGSSDPPLRKEIPNTTTMARTTSPMSARTHGRGPLLPESAAFGSSVGGGAPYSGG